jgi:hypothetical protein
MPLGIGLSGSGGFKEGLLFCKKEAKNFWILVRVARQHSTQMDKSFLVLFFKKKLFLRFDYGCYRTP